MTAPSIFSRPAFPVQSEASKPRPRFLPSTRLATPSGPRPVELLVVGDELMTRDGPKRIKQIARLTIRRSDAALRRDSWPVRVPVGSLGNPVPVRLRSDQRVVLEGDQVLDHCDLPRVSVPVSDLVGLRGLMSERPRSDLRWFGLSLEGGGVFRVEGALCEIEDGPSRDEVSREAVRAAFAAMNAVGQPRLVAF